MRYYENLSPLERRKIVLGAVAFSSAMEGMTQSRDECLKELRELERAEIENLPKQPDDPKG